MKRLWKFLRYSGLGVFSVSILTVIQGCDIKEISVGLLALLMLLLAGSGGSTTEGIEVTMMQTTIGVGNSFVSQSITFKANVDNPSNVSSFDWDFGDGGSGSGQVVTHVYASTGTFDISVTINRGGSQQALSTKIVIKDVQGPATLTVNGTGSGDIVGNPNAINCTLTNDVASGTCTDAVSLSSTHTLTATAATGFQFDAWSNCSSPSGNICTHNVTADVTISADFVQTFTLTVTLDAATRIFSDIGGIDCPGVCSATFPAGTVVQLTGETNFTFYGWTGNVTGVDVPCVTGSASHVDNRNPVSVNMNRDRHCIPVIIL